jgi:predicted Rossmann fold flavoprotein
LTHTPTTVIIGGGAAGFFAAINLAEKNREQQIIILEKSAQLLGKVKVSGGGRCNVTHACFEPKELVKFYPRGNKALLSPFYSFNANDTVEWFKSRGVRLKTEADGRMFPVTDNSQTIIDCFLSEAKKYGVKIRTEEGVVRIEKTDVGWNVITNKEKTIAAENIIVAAGSSPQMWNILKALGHTIVAPVPSLFTFNVKDKRIDGLPGVAVTNASVHIQNTHQKQSGPLLITHWGFSGPAVLKLSAWAARELHAVQYQFNIVINWNADYTLPQVQEYFASCRKNQPKQKVTSHSFPNIPSRLWQRLAEAANIQHENWSDVTSAKMQSLAQQVTQCTFSVNGKSTFKDEFVTAGGVDLNEVNFKTMESKLHPNLFFAGELLDIDAVTGGYNFQAAWTTAWIAAEAIMQ